jgi:hypothetical protein
VSRAPAKHPSALEWARHVAGETRGFAGFRFRRHLEVCAACSERAAAADRERREFEGDPRHAQAAAALRQRAERLSARARRPRWMAWALVAPAVAVAAVVFATSDTQRLAAKGGDVFTLHVDRPSGSRPLDSTCAAGDRIMARYRTGRQYLLIVERDGAGEVQAVHPFGGNASVRLVVSEGVTPQSWRLDQTPGEECFFAFFSDQPVSLSAARTALGESPAVPSLPLAAVRRQCCHKGVR